MSLNRLELKKEITDLEYRDIGEVGGNKIAWIWYREKRKKMENIREVDKWRKK